ncbi:PilN domain-containing protein [Kosakonia oryzae]|uniref:PilN domain-containing protein n=1 Tax=Kosakonia oryzae TaxID=497725 RepID=A0AA94H8H2_9ENTR|nr:PilN domain-containing protein [Kosakonia oryzae]ANI80936.1 PilN domain-containing protein [Kosakonia oryzae]SFD22894.1 pilus assembly protein HofN [Kosakonia oryzae]
MAGVNFLPWRQYRRRRRVRFWMSVFIASLLLTGGVGLLWRASVAVELHGRALWQQADAALLASLKAGEKPLLARQEAWRREQVRKQRRQDTQAWQPRLLSLAANLPQNAWLTQLRWQQNQLTLSGFARSVRALGVLEQQLRSIAGFQLQPTGAMERDAQGRWQFHYQLNKENKDVPER